MLRFIALQVGSEPVDLLGYAERDQTRRDRTLSTWLTEQARGTDNGLALDLRAFSLR